MRTALDPTGGPRSPTRFEQMTPGASRNNPLRVVFMGTPELAATALEGLYQAGYDLPLVVTRTDRPGGRGYRQACSPVKRFAAEKGLALYQPPNIKEAEALGRIREASPDVVVAAAYGKILPPPILEAAPLGCLNIHASLLPAYRGAAPIQQALLNGGGETGVTIMKMDEGLDTGPILLQEKFTIAEDMDYGSLYAALAGLGARLLLEALPLWAEGRLKPKDQPAEGATYAGLMERKHEIIDWSWPADRIRNQIRAFSPSPGASARLGGKEIKILGARILSDESITEAAEVPALPGQIVGVLRREGPVVAAGEGRLLLTKLQPAGKKPMDGWAWLNGSRAAPGQCFEQAVNPDQ